MNDFNGMNAPSRQLVAHDETEESLIPSSFPTLILLSSTRVLQSDTPGQKGPTNSGGECRFGTFLLL